MAPILLALLFALPARAETKLPPLPWHLVDVWWEVGAQREDFESLSMEITLSRDMPSADYDLYVAPVSGAFEDGTQFYGGLQTNIGGYPASNPSDRSGPYEHGKGAIFSRWGDGLDLSFVHAEAGGFVEAAGYEGDFVSGRRPFAWKAGAYEFEIRRLSTERKDGKDWTWAAAEVTDEAAHKRVRVAALKFPGRRLRLSSHLATFVEFYGAKPVDIPNLPPLEIGFGRPMINGKPAPLARVRAVHPAGSDESAAPPILTAEASADGERVNCRLSNRLLTDRAAEYGLKVGTPQK